MMESLKSITEIPDLRRRILFTLAMLAVYRLGAVIPTPGINADAFEQMFNQSIGGRPFWTAGHVFGRQLAAADGLCAGNHAVYHGVDHSSVVGRGFAHPGKAEEGRRAGPAKDHGVHALAHRGPERVSGFRHCDGSAKAEVRSWLTNPGPGFVLRTVLTLTTGAVFIMWLGEQITSRGIGNGMSLLIFAGIVAGLPRGMADLYEKVFVTRVWSPLALLLLLVFMVAIVAFIVLVERGERRVPIQYAKRIVGRKVMGGVSTHLPLKVNSGGVMPIIFAVSILTFPQTVGLFLSKSSFLGSLIDKFVKPFAWGEPLYTFSYVLLIMFFAHFYLSIVYNPDEVADNVRKQGGFIPGIRPGQAHRRPSG